MPFYATVHECKAIPFAQWMIWITTFKLSLVMGNGWKMDNNDELLSLILKVFLSLLLPFLVVYSEPFWIHPSRHLSESFHNTRAVIGTVLLHYAASLVGANVHTLLVRKQGIERHADHEYQPGTHDGHDWVGGWI